MALNLKICLLFAILVAGFGVDGRYFKRDARQIGSNVCESTGYGTCIPLYPGSNCDENTRPCNLPCGGLGSTCCCYIYATGR